ncbi:MAG TPA: lactonase family protein [Lacunisphaera sp.]|nr:lactonase family protein [Lacunisphaera sp.]
MSTPHRPASLTAFIGTYTKDNSSRGIYATRLDVTTGALSTPTVAAETSNPTFLALHPNGRFLYSLGQLPLPDGKSGGAIEAYALDSGSGRLNPLNRESSGGAGLAHLAIDATGRMLVAVSYHGGYVTAFPLGADGRVGPPTGRIALEGQPGPNRLRQNQSHAHSVTIAPDNRFALVADLGLDRVFSFRLDVAAARLVPNDPPSAVLPPGAGPRHAKFSADGRFLYVLNEIDGSISSCRYDAARGVATPFQHISTLPAGFKVTDPDRAAEIRIHPNGRYVYASNRGHDSIAVFARADDGALQLVDFTPCGGKHPRNFNLSPDGTWLVCANMDSNNLVVFQVDPGTGRLASPRATAAVPAPVCVLFAP